MGKQKEKVVDVRVGKRGGTYGVSRPQRGSFFIPREERRKRGTSGVSEALALERGSRYPYSPVVQQDIAHHQGE